jgi:hypothetical protein
VWQISCDESRVDGCRHMLIGALIIPPEALGAFVTANIEFRNATKNNFAHFKWEKATSKKKLPDYLALIDMFFNLPIFFKCIIIEKCRVDYKRYHRNDRELGFYKFYFLLLSRLVKFEKQYLVRVHRRLDKNRGRLADLRDATNNWCRNKSRRYITPLQTVEGANFNDYTELQIVDVLLGAVGYHWDQAHVRPNASQSKIAICNKICERLGKDSLCFQSYYWSDKKFNLWKWQPK